MLSNRPTHFDDAPFPSLFGFGTTVLDTTLPQYRKTNQDFYTSVGSLVTPAFRPDQGHAKSPDIRRAIERIHEKHSRRLSQELSAGSSSPISWRQDSIRKMSPDLLSKQDSHGWRNGSRMGFTTTDPGSVPKSRTPSDTMAYLPPPASSPSRSRGSLDASVSPMINSFTCSSSNSPENLWTSRKPNFTPPPSSVSYNASRSNSLGSVIAEQPKNISDRKSQASKRLSRPSRKNRRPTHEIFSVTDDGSSITIPLDVESASSPEGERRKQEREAAKRYRQNKKARKFAREQIKRSQTPTNGIVSSSDDDQAGRATLTLAPPASAEMNLSTSQRSYSSIHSGSTDVTSLSGSTPRSSHGTTVHGWPDLPELHPYERREKIDYEILAPYGSPEAIQTYPASFQASLHRTMDFQRIEHLKAMSHCVLFVYGSLMISDLSHDISEEPTDWIFHAQITKQCMCPAKVRRYSRFSVHDGDEPVMMKSEKTSQDSTHGMLIFGLTEDNLRVLDRYLSRGFVREEVTAHVNLKGSSTSFPVLTYVWPQLETPPEAPQQHVRINQGAPWTVEHFWKQGQLCRIWRETIQEWKAELAKVAEQRAMAATQYFDMLRVPLFPHEDFVGLSDVAACMS